MAKVWLVSAEREQTTVRNAGEVPVWKCISKLKLRREHRLIGCSEPERFIDKGAPDIETVLVEVTEADADARGWEIGFYKIPMTSRETQSIMQDN